MGRYADVSLYVIAHCEYAGLALGALSDREVRKFLSAHNSEAPIVMPRGRS